MQQEAIAAVKKGTDVILISPTGSGKTLAFLLPVIDLLKGNKPGVKALVLVPSRELALQIEKVFRQLQTGYKVNTCYGGHPITTELNNLTVPPELLIGTPGRIADHIRRDSFTTQTISTLVLDEFDKSLELGFAEEMQFIIHSLNNIKTRVLTSATSLDPIPDFVGLKKPIVIDYSIKTDESKRFNFKVVKAETRDKLDLLFRLICFIGNKSSVIFCNHREAVNRISNLLYEQGIAHGIYHGGQEQEQRELSLIKFRNGTHHILLTTDLASRGLDIPEISNVIHYQLPGSDTAWTHRNGRTARMDRSGTIWVLLASEDYLPDFINSPAEEVSIGNDFEIPDVTEWETLYISAGRKDKISKGDVAGFLMQKGLLKQDEIGEIEVLDYASFVAIRRNLVKQVLKQLKGEQIKKKTVKIAIAIST